MKKQSLFLKISILFIIVAMLFGFCNLNVFAENISVKDNSIDIKMGDELKHEITLKAGETIDVNFINEKTGKKLINQWFWYWKKVEGEDNILSAIQNKIITAKEGVVKYEVRNTLRNLTATINITVVEPDLHVYSSESSVVKKGDFNGDNLVTSYDVKLLSQKINGSFDAKYDIDENGVLTEDDVTMLQSYVNNPVTTFAENYLYNGTEMIIRINEDSCSAWEESDLTMSNLEYTAKLNGENFNDLEIKIDKNDKKVGILKINENADIEGKVLEINFKIKDRDLIPEINLDDTVENVNGKESNSSRNKTATVQFFLKNRVKKAEGEWKIFINEDETTASIFKYLGTGTDFEIPNTLKIEGTENEYLITGIKEGAFAETSVQSLTINENISEIEEGAFSGAKNLEKIEVNNNINYASVDGVLYKLGDTTTSYIGIIKYPEAKKDLTSYVIENVEDEATTYIAKEAFMNVSLTEIIIPDNLNEIRKGAFKDSVNLTTIKNNTNYPTDLDTLDAIAKDDPRYGKSANLPNSLTLIAEEAFYGCSSLGDIVIPTVASLKVGKILDKEYSKIGEIIENGKIVKNYAEIYAYRNKLKDSNVFEGMNTESKIMFYPENEAMSFYHLANGVKLLGEEETEANFYVIGTIINDKKTDDSTTEDGVPEIKNGKYDLNIDNSKHYELSMKKGETVYLNFSWDMFDNGTGEIDEAWVKFWELRDPSRLSTGGDYDSAAGFVELSRNENFEYMLTAIGNIGETRTIRIGSSVWALYYVDITITIEKPEFYVDIDTTNPNYISDTVSDTMNNTNIEAGIVYEGRKDKYKAKDESGNLINDTIALSLKSTTLDRAVATPQVGVKWSVTDVKVNGSSIAQNLRSNYLIIGEETGIVELKQIPVQSNAVATIQADLNGMQFYFELTIKPRIITANNYKCYIINEKEVELLSYLDKTASTISIPKMISQQYQLVDIAEGAISDCSATTINIQTENIETEKTITKLSEGIIKNCSKLKTINISKHITEIDPLFIKDCKAFKEIGVSSDNENYMTYTGGKLEGCLLTKDGKTLVLVPPSCGTSDFVCNLPETVTTIGEYAFYENKIISALWLTDNLNEIKPFAFYGMGQLTEIVIPPSVKTIGNMSQDTITNINSDLYKSGIENPESTVAEKLKQLYSEETIGHVFSKNDNGESVKVYFDYNSVIGEYGYYFGLLEEDTLKKLEIEEIPEYITGIVGSGNHEAVFEGLNVVACELYKDGKTTNALSCGERYVGETITDEELTGFELLICYDMSGAVKNMPECSYIDITSDMLSYKEEGIYNDFEKFEEKMISDEYKLYVTYSDATTTTKVKEILIVKVTAGELEVDDSNLTTRRFLEGTDINNDTIKNQLAVNKISSTDEKIAIGNDEYQISLDMEEQAIKVVCPSNAGTAYITEDITIYSEDEVERFENLSDEAYEQLKELLKDNIIHFDDETKTIVIPKEDIQNGDIPRLKVGLTKKPEKVFYTKGKQGDETVSLEGAEIVVKYVVVIAEPDIEYVLATKGAESISLDNNNIDELLTETVGTADIAEQTKLTLKPNYNGIELSEFDIIVEPAEIENIYVAETFVKKEYLDGEKFQKNGFKLMADYAGEIADAEIKEGYTLKIGETELIDDETEIRLQKNNSTETTYEEVSVEYLGKTADVCDIAVKEYIATGIYANVTNENFVEGQDPTSDNNLTATLDIKDKNGNIQSTSFTGDQLKENFIVEPQTLSVGDTEITVKYKYNAEHVYTITGINVVAKAIEKVELQAWENMPTQYVENVNWEGAQVKVTYNDGEEKIIVVKDNLNNQDLVIEGLDSTKAGPNNVSVSYKGIKATEIWEMYLIEKVSKIEILTYPKTEYLVGSDIDLSKGTLKITYEREGVKPEIVYMTDSRVTVEGNTGKATENKELIVKFGDFQKEISITVFTKDKIQITGIEIVKEPLKTKYKKGEQLDFAGAKAKVTYKFIEDSKVGSDIIDITNSEIFEIDSSAVNSEADGTYDVIVKVKDTESIEDKFAIQICENKKVMEKIESIVNTGMKEEYLPGQKLDIKNLLIIMISSTNSTNVFETVEELEENFIFEPDVISQNDNGKSVTVKYKYNQNQDTSAVIPNLTLKVIPISNISFSEEPRTKYFQGEELDLTTGEIKIEYSDGTEPIYKKLSEISENIIGFDGNKLGSQEIIVNYCGAITTYNVEVIEENKVTELSVEQLPNKTTYNVGDELDLTGGKLKVKYWNSSVNKVESVVIPMTSSVVEVVEADLSTGGMDKKVILRCGETETDFTIDVYDKDIASIEVKQQPNNLKYVEGQVFNPDGMIVIEKSKGGAELRELTQEEYIIEAPETLTKDNKDNIVIKYKANEELTAKVEGIAVYSKDEVQEFTLTTDEFNNVKEQLADKIVNAIEEEGKVQLALLKGVVEIEVQIPENDEEYIVGQELDLSRYSIVIYYGEGSEKLQLTTATLTNSMVTEDGSPYVFTKEQAGKEVEITVKFLGGEDKFNVRVKDSEVSQIEIEGTPTRTKYLENEEFSLDGIKIIGKNQSGEQVRILTNDEVIIEPAKLVKGLNQTIKITAKENSDWTVQISGIDVYVASQVKEITVSEDDYNAVKDDIADKLILKEELSDGNVKLVLIPAEITLQVRAVTNKEYNPREALDLENYKVGVYYGIGAAKLKITEVTLNESMLLNSAYIFTDSQAGTEVEIMVSYLGAITTFKVKVKSIEVTGLKIIGTPKQEYFVGDEIDLTGLELEVTYSNTATEKVAIEEAQVFGFSTTTPGTKTIILIYEGQRAYFNIVVKNVDITNLEIIGTPKTEYYIGDQLDLSGLKLKANYSNNTSEEIEITNDMITGFDSQTAGAQVVTVTYKGMTTTFVVDVQDVVITGIEIVGTPKTEYFVGDQLDITGLKLKASYSNGKSEEIDITNDMITGFNTQTAGTKTIKVTYKDKTATFVIKVESSEVSDLTLVGTPKTEYFVGDKIDLTGLSLKVTYLNGTSKQVAVTNSMISGFNSQNAGKQTVKVSYEGGTTTFIVNVKALEITDLSIIGTPKTEYFVGDQLDISGLKLKVSYSNNTSKQIIVTSSMVTGFNSQKEGTQTIIVSYEGATATFVVNVKPIEITGISIVGTPKTEYYVGDQLDISGLKLKVTYSNGTTKNVTITNNMVTGFDSQTAGIKTITVSYEGATTTFVVDVKAIEITGISIVGTPKTEYYVGDKLDLSGLKLKVTYSNGTSEEVAIDKATVSGFDTDVAGTRTVTITYEGEIVTFDINIAKTEEPSISLGSLKLQTLGNETYLRIEDIDMTVAELKEIIRNANKTLDLEIQVLDNKGNVIADTEVFTTGMIIKISSDTETKEFILAKVGYINSDNKVNISDLMKLLIHLAEKMADNPNTEKILTGAQLVAADVTGDGKVNTFDIIPLLNLINEAMSSL